MDLFEQSVAFALRAHEGQKRKRENLPFILHPCEAATIAATLTDDPEVLAAVMLHDTVEDTDVTLEDIRIAFGDRVAELVAGETEPAYADVPRKESWKRRKEASLNHLKATSDPGVKIMWLSDKLANVRSFYRQYLTSGSEMWDAYNMNDPAQQAWYYRTVVSLLSDYADTAAYIELAHLVDAIFGGD